MWIDFDGGLNIKYYSKLLRPIQSSNPSIERLSLIYVLVTPVNCLRGKMLID